MSFQIPIPEISRPWKSQWLINLERKLAEPLPVYKRAGEPTPPIEAKKKPATSREPGPKKKRDSWRQTHPDYVWPNRHKQACSAGCGRRVGYRNKTGRCRWCQPGAAKKTKTLIPPAVEMPGPVELLMTDEMFEGMHE